MTRVLTIQQAGQIARMPLRARIMELLVSNPELSQAELCAATGAAPMFVKALFYSDEFRLTLAELTSRKFAAQANKLRSAHFEASLAAAECVRDMVAPDSETPDSLKLEAAKVAFAQTAPILAPQVQGAGGNTPSPVNVTINLSDLERARGKLADRATTLALDALDLSRPSADTPRIAYDTSSDSSS